MNRVISKLRILVFGGLALAATICMFPATSNADAVVTVEGTQYDVSTVTTTFSIDESLLEAQPWWGNTSLAAEFATAVGLDFGLPNQPPPPFGPAGPLFATSTNFVVVDSVTIIPPNPDPVEIGFSRITDTRVYATATLITTPEPGTLSLMFSGLLVVGLLVGVNRHRENRPAIDA